MTQNTQAIIKACEHALTHLPMPPIWASELGKFILNQNVAAIDTNMGPPKITVLFPTDDYMRQFSLAELALLHLRHVMFVAKEAEQNPCNEDQENALDSALVAYYRAAELHITSHEAHVLPR